MGDKYLSYDQFADPDVEYRPEPFWGLNDDLDDEVIRHQVREMKDKGWGGFFTHARYGLETPYLGDEYMERMKTAVDEAKKQGIKAWIYDEHPFPAGCAGGLATACKKEYRHKALVMRMHNRLTPIDPEEARGYFAVELDEHDVPISCHPVTDPENYNGPEHHFMHFYLWTESCNQTHQPGFSNYDDNIIHGFPSSDNLNPDAAKKFIDVTYGSYKKAVGDEFGKTLMGGFSDIPCSNWNYATPHPSIPWTIGFEEYFKKEAGYDILPELPGLFYNLGNYKKVRCDYWRISNKLFVESFTKQLYDWCDENGIQYTAHYWGEETLHWQIPWVGDCMTHFMYQHMVSMDHSIRNIEDPLGIKQASTVAEQLGRERMASETYGMGGHNLTHKERRWIADWEYALGTNFLIPYVCLYSYRGRRKRDEPSSLFVQQAYWEYEKYMYDYYGRLSYALTVGKRQVDILLMQPLNTAWTMYTPSLDYPQAHRPDPLEFEGSTEELYSYNKEWMAISDSLLAMHRDFHVGNESVMENHGSVEGDRIVVGEYRYKVVIVPSSASWAPSTVRFLNEFAANGGIVIAVRPVPVLIDGETAEKVLPDSTILIDDFYSSLEKVLDEKLEKDIVMENNCDILYQHRVSEREDIYFVANTSLDNSYLHYTVKIPGKGYLEMWDGFTGEKYRVPAEEKDGYIMTDFDFYPVSSYLFVRRDDAPELPDYPRIPTEFKREKALSSGWDVTFGDPNALNLDYCRVKVGRSDWTETMPVWKAHRIIKQGGVGSSYQIQFRFYVKELVKDIKCMVETPDKLKVSVNGTYLDLEKPVGTYLDPCYALYPIGEMVREGENIITIEGVLGIGSDVENCYLFGDFALDRTEGFSVVAPKKHVIGNDITKEGYPFLLVTFI
ncbi:MAG: glycosyl hydrolase [Candidatus Choladocola sp.]|nr:glycosyl hydrolase [Candidatus Choladocola sp.]